MIQLERLHTEHGEARLTQVQGESDLLREEAQAFWAFAQEGWQQQGRGCILIGRSQSMEDLSEEGSVATYLVDYLPLTALLPLRGQLGEENVQSRVGDVAHLLQRYDPTVEFFAAFFDGDGFGNVYRVDASTPS